MHLRALSLALLSASCTAQKASAPIVNPDRSITFRISAPAAQQVELALDLYPKHTPMTKGPDGIWTVTTPPLDPEYYGYDIVIDGQTQLDPLNPDVRLNTAFLANQVLVPGTPPAPWELTAIPHGRVDHIRFTTRIGRHFPSNQSAYIVYTPPGYDPKRTPGYPVLYLLHGWSDIETAWIATGRADLIMDSLIATRQAVPMIVVMPLGYGDLGYKDGGMRTAIDPTAAQTNLTLFSSILLNEILPVVDRTYNTAPGAKNRAIIGLSMGGAESLSIGLNHPTLFSYIGGMSAAIQQERFDDFFPNLDANQARLSLLWVACGKEDSLLPANRRFVEWAQSKHLPITPVEIPGGHVWLPWRDNLLHFAQLLFQPK